MLKNIKKSNTPKISVVIPCFNSEKYIASTLNSIFSQSFFLFEVIVEDGGSSDRTVQIIKKYAKKYPNLKWESRKDKGQCDAINKGLKKAKGDILTYINSDDVYQPRAFENISKAYLENPDKYWFAGGGIVVDDKGREIVKPVSFFKNLLLRINNSSLLLLVNYLMQPSIFVTREAFKKYGPFVGETFVMEYDLWLKLGKVQMPYIINKNLSSFRLTKDNITSNQTNRLLMQDWEIVNKYTDNKIILFFHWLSIWGRKLVLEIV